MLNLQRINLQKPWPKKNIISTLTCNLKLLFVISQSAWRPVMILYVLRYSTKLFYYICFWPWNFRKKKRKRGRGLSERHDSRGRKPSGRRGRRYDGRQLRSECRLSRALRLGAGLIDRIYISHPRKLQASCLILLSYKKPHKEPCYVLYIYLYIYYVSTAVRRNYEKNKEDRCREGNKENDRLFVNFFHFNERVIFSLFSKGIDKAANFSLYNELIDSKVKQEVHAHWDVSPQFCDLKKTYLYDLVEACAVNHTAKWER